MEMNFLKVFYEVAKCGSFTEAAKRLHISQSALSRAVALLEEGEGVQLFERSKRGVALTSIGSEVLLRCEHLFQSVREIENLCRGTRETCEGFLRFAATDHITNELLADQIQAFRRRFPKVIPSILTTTPDEIAKAVLETEIEFGLIFVKVPLPQLEYQKLRPEQMALVCQTEVWRRNRQATNDKTLKAVLQDVGYIASIGATQQKRSNRVLTELFGEMPPIGIEVSGQETQKVFCLKGGGVAYLAHFMVDAEIRSGQLFEIPVDDPHTFDMWLVTRKGKKLSLAALSFLRFLNEEGITPLFKDII
jgi:LysR family transcriptional regulator, cyn operon transcriptional activator